MNSENDDGRNDEALFARLDEEMEPHNTQIDFSLPAAIERLRSLFDVWDANEKTSRATLYEALGLVSETAFHVDQHEHLRQELINLVNERSDVTASRRWDARRKSSFELLLTLKFGLAKEFASHKSNWLKVLNLAHQQGRGTTQSDFIAWIASTGGLGKALQLGRGEASAFDFEAFTEAVEGHSDAGPEVEWPHPLESAAPSGFAVVLVRVSDAKEGEPRRVKPVEIITNEKVVARIAASVEAQWERNNRMMMQEAERERPLRVPPKLRHLLNGRSQFSDEEEETEFFREHASFLRGRGGKRRRQRTQPELAKKGSGKATLPDHLAAEEQVAK